MLVVMKRVIMNYNNYAENLGKRSIIIFALIDLRKDIKDDIAFVTKAKICKNMH